MKLLYPCDPFNKKQADEAYEEEYLAAQSAGLTCFLFSTEDFDSGEFNPKPSAMFEGEILYRGWMLTPDRYGDLQRAIESNGGTTIVSAAQYRKCHHLPEWYADCQDLTPKTVFLTKDEDYSTALARTGWDAYFVKDYVKSLTTTRGSVAKSANEVREIVDLIERYRGQLEGGVCVRELEDLVAETEERYFVFRGRAFGREGNLPQIVDEVASRIDSPFFSVDIVLNRNGTPRLVELGDGQVSDRKRWSAAQFVEMLSD